MVRVIRRQNNILVLLLLFLPGILLAQAPAQKYRAIVQVTSANEESWASALRHIDNLRNDLGKENVAVEVVMHSSAIKMALAKGKLAEKMESLASTGVAFAACNNSMRREQITKDQLYPFVTVVPSGVGELVKKQNSGWAYLKID